MRSCAARVMYKLYLYCVVRVASLYRMEHPQITCSFGGNVSVENVSLRRTTSVGKALLNPQRCAASSYSK